MDEKMMGGCTGSCNTCGSVCEGGQKKAKLF